VITKKDFEYVLAEGGFKGRNGVEFDEVVEICGNLKEVSFAPKVNSASKTERRRIPVEKSGGGV